MVEPLAAEVQYRRGGARGFFESDCEDTVSSSSGFDQRFVTVVPGSWFFGKVEGDRGRRVRGVQ